MMLLVAVCLILIGSLFIYLMGRSYLRANAMRDWPVVECIILESSIEQRQHDPYSPQEFSHQVLYGYDWEGHSYTGKRISLRGVKWSSKGHGVDRSRANYPVGSIQRCHVNPDDPLVAVLELDSLAPLYSIWFPSLFVIGGLGILITAIRPRKTAR